MNSEKDKADAEKVLFELERSIEKYLKTINRNYFIIIALQVILLVLLVLQLRPWMW